MPRNSALIWITAIVCLLGCHKADKIKTSGSFSRSPDNVSQHLDTPAGMVEYLQKQELPDLKSVKVWDNKYGPGLTLTTAHYEIFTTLLEPLMLRSVPAFVEAAYRGYNSQLAEPIETKTKFTIYLFANRRQWEDFTKPFAGEQAELFCKIQSGAYYLNGACVTYNIGIERTFTALGHEGWHQFNSRLFKFRLPSWLDEGVAMLFEAHKPVPSTVEGSEQETFYFKPDENAYRLEELKKTLSKKKMIPLSQLITINPSEVLSMDQSEVVAAFYSQSYALVRFLREADYSKRLDRYRKLLLDGLRGNWPLDKTSKRVAIDRNLPRTVGWNRAVGQLLFERYIGEDIDRIEKEYLIFCWSIVSNAPIKTQD